MSWLSPMLSARIIDTEPNSGDNLASNSWHVPEIHTLCINTNIETKKTRVDQSIFFRISTRFLLSRTGDAEIIAIQLRLKFQAGKNSTRKILQIMRINKRERAFFALLASSGSVMASSDWVGVDFPNSSLKKSFSTI